MVASEVDMPRNEPSRVYMQDVESSNVVAIGYDEDRFACHVEFKGKAGAPGPRYVYFDVSPATYNIFVECESKGTFVHSVLKAGVKAGKYRVVGPS